MTKEQSNETDALLLQDHEEVREIVDEVAKKKSKYCKLPFIHKMYWFFYRNPLNFLVFIPSIIVGYTSIQSNLYTGKIVDALTTDDPIPAIKHYAFMMFIMAIINAILNFINNTFWNQIGSSINCKIKSLIFKKYMQNDVSYFDRTTIGDSLTLLNEDSNQVSSVFNFSKYIQIRNIGQLLSSIVVGLTVNAPITIIAVIATIIQDLVLERIRRYGIAHMRANFKVRSQATTVSLEQVSNPRVIYSYGQEEEEINKFFNIADRSSKLETVAHEIFSVSFGTEHTLSQGIWSVILGVGGYFLLKDQITAGSLVSMMRIIATFSFLIGMLLGTLNHEVKSMESANRIFDFLEGTESVDLKKGFAPEKFDGEIEFRNVWFKYPTRENWILKNVSFKINAGEIVAFVGHSGCGKSTIVQLLLRFYDVNEGKVLIDGRDIKDYAPSFIHRSIGVVQQDSALFTLSVKDNIKYGNVDATDAEVEEAAKIAFADKFIQKLPKKYDSMIGEKGTTLSGGQRQRVAIARAVLMNPKLMITDEATSALDAVSEKKVEKALRAVMEQRTSVIIAHRLGTIRCASKIYVLDNGEIVESGSHEELIALKGHYYELVKIQLE